MRRILVLIAGTALLLGLPRVASAQQYPTVTDLKPYAAEANLMSLPGFLRYLTFQQTGEWLTWAEAERVVQQQSGK